MRQPAYGRSLFFFPVLAIGIPKGILPSVESRRAKKIIQTCIARRQYRVTRHFAERLEQRIFFWGDVLAVIDDPTDVREDGLDDFWPRKMDFRRQWRANGTEIEIVIDQDGDGNLSILVTLYEA